MPKALSISSLAIAALLFLIFGLDLALGIPFGRMSFGADIAFLIGAGILGYIGYLAFRETS
jgi:hypothetical protein